MKQNIIFLSIAIPVFFIVMSFSKVPTKNLPNTYNYKNTETISFRVKGNGKTNVSLGVADKPGGIGSCCRGVSSMSTVSFQGRIGDVLYDSKTQRIIIKLYAGLKGQIIDLKDYY